MIDFSLDTVIRSEWGGSHPEKDDVIKLRAKITNNVIYVFVVGKWRSIRYYAIKKKIPSKKIQDEVIRIVNSNMGGALTKYNKPVELIWENIE